MPEVVEKNRIIEKLVRGGILSQSSLKRFYHQLCKATHPDLNSAGKDDFIKLQEEYRQALDFLEKSRGDYIHPPHRDFSVPLDPGRQFYQALQYYTVSGLHSMRVRNKKELKVRNLKIMKEVIFWANWYDNSFIPLFLRYNKIYLRPLAPQEVEKRLKKARILFLNALNWLFKYKLQGIKTAGRTSDSYICDAIFELESINHKYYKDALLEFAFWIKKELQRPAGQAVK